MSIEPLSIEDESRFTTFPIIKGRELIEEEYLKQQRSFWVRDQVSMKEDQIHWKEGLLYPNTIDLEEMKKNDSAKEFIILILAFFSSADKLVIDNLDENFMKEFKWLEVTKAYSFQMMMEYTHSDAYGIQIDQLITDIEEKEKIFKAIKKIDCVKRKAKFVFKYMNKKTVDKEYKEKSLAVRLIAFAAIEGILFSGEFASIYWLQSLNRMPGLADYNELISKDEGMHTDFACILYNNFIVNKLNQNEVFDIINDATNVEIEFITKAISCDMIGMKKHDMSLYIKFVSNRLLVQLGYNELYKNIENPFPFMNNISLQSKSNFFELKPQSYNIAIVPESEKNIFSENSKF